MASKKTIKSAKAKGGKTVKKATAKKALKKPAKKLAKNVTKKVAKKVKKKIVKKVANKAIKKGAKKVAKKPTKKVTKKVAKKPTTKTVTSKKVASKKKSKPSSENKSKVTTPTQTETLAVPGKNFLFTGTLTSMKRKDAEQNVLNLGGYIIGAVGEKVDYLVVGDKAGSKLKEAKKFKNIQVIDEQAFVDLLANDLRLQNKGGEDSKTEGQYKIKFDIYGYGAENCVTSLSKEQIAYWKKKYKEDEYDAQQELKDHVWNYEYDEDIPETHFGKWYDQDSIVHAERAYYSESSRLIITVMKDGEEVEEIDIPVTDSKIKKEFFDEFVPDKKRNKGEAFLWTHSSDRGSYCHGEFEIPDGKPFDVSKVTLIVKNIFDDAFVWNLCYDDEYLEDEGCYDSTGKGFDANIYFF
jgi:BRCT domain type II-containing protein